MPGGNRDRDMCSARTRRAMACMRKALDNGRCPNHGGFCAVRAHLRSRRARARTASKNSKHAPRSSYLAGHSE
jgi:hypothetical protein